MFPNLRLLIGAVLASVVALCCGFAGFAAFRVNHEPLRRLPTDTAALQLVADEPARPAATWGVPFGPLAGETRTGGAAVNAPATAPVRQAAIKVPDAAAPPRAAIDATGTLPPPHALPAAPSIAPTTTAPASSRASPTAPASAPSSTAAPAPPAPAASAPPAQSAAAESQSTQPAPAAQPVGATGSATQTAAIETSAAMPASEAFETAKRVPGRKVARKPAVRHRVALKRRVIRKPAAAALAQSDQPNSGVQEPVFRSAPGFQQQSQTPPRDGNKSADSSAVTYPFAWLNAH